MLLPAYFCCAFCASRMLAEFGKTCVCLSLQLVCCQSCYNEDGINQK